MLGVLMDMIYQLMVSRGIYLFELVNVVLVLAFLPVPPASRADQSPRAPLGGWRQVVHTMTADAHDLPDATRLAVDRTRLAADRTLLAWVRTATSLISFGFTVYKFFQYLRESSPSHPGGLFGPREFALVAISLGIIALLLATVEHRRSMEGLRGQYGISNVPYSLATVLAALISCFGVLGLVAVIFHQ